MPWILIVCPDECFLFTESFLKVTRSNFTPSSLCFPSEAGLLKGDVSPDGGGSGGDTISHPLTLVQHLEALLAQGNGSDVSLRVETPNGDEVKVIQAHGLVLSLQSPVFQEMLQSRNGSTLVLRESSDCAAVFDRFIR